jgi:hypothetical protein
VFIFAGAIQGYVAGVGTLFPNTRWSGLLRLPVLIGAILIALPGEAVPGWSDLDLLLAGLALIAPVLGFALFLNRKEQAAVLPGLE